MRPRPIGILLYAKFARKTHRLLDLLRIRVALLDQTHWQTMSAEYQMNSRTVRKLPQYGSDSLNQRLNIEWMIVKIVDGALRSSPCGRSPVCLIRDPRPFLQAAQCRSVGIVRIQRQQDDFIQRRSLS